VENVANEPIRPGKKHRYILINHVYRSKYNSALFTMIF
jgi:hypothetical protein